MAPPPRTCPRCRGPSADDGLCQDCRGSLASSSSLDGENETMVGIVRRLSGIGGSSDFARNYRMAQILGAGATGLVYLATHLPTGQQRAVKFLAVQDNSELSIRFVAEGRMLAALGHANVVRVFDVGDVDGIAYLAMEYLTGGTLRDRLRSRGRMALGQAVQVMADCLAGLAACHERGIVHRDFKPENVLFDESGTAKLADLGLARATQFVGFEMTQKGTVLGTPKYMSPEQGSGEPATQLSDIYSAGIVLFELLAGRPPFVGDTELVTIALQIQAPPPPLEEAAPDVPPPVARLVRRALAKNPQDRPASASRFLDELVRVTGVSRAVATIPSREVVPPVSAAPAADRPGPAPRSRIVAALVAAAVLIALAAGAWQSRSRVSGRSGLAIHLTWTPTTDLVFEFSGHPWPSGGVVARPVGGGDELQTSWSAPAGANRTTMARLGSLRPGQKYSLHLFDETGKERWKSTVEAPAIDLVTLRCPTGPGGPTRLTVSEAREPLPVLVLQESAGERDERHGRPESSRIVFDKLPPLARLPRTVNLEIASGEVPTTVSVDPVRALAAALCRDIGRLQVESLIQRVVYEPAFSPHLVSSVVGAFFDGMDRTRPEIMTFRSRFEKRAAGIPADHFARVVWRSLAEVRVANELAGFRPFATRFFEHAESTDGLARAAYDAILKLQYLELLIESQLETDFPRLSTLYAGLVRLAENLPPGRIPYPGESLKFSLDAPRLWVPETVDDSFWKGYINHHSWDAALLRFITGLTRLPTVAEMKRASASNRVSGDLRLATGQDRDRAFVRAVVALMPPAYFFEVRFVPLRPDEEPFRVLLAHPGTKSWHQAEADLDDQGSFFTFSLDERGERRLRWGELVATFPAAFLPRGGFQVRTSLRIIPGVPPRKLLAPNAGALIQRLDFGLLATSGPPGGRGASN